MKIQTSELIGPALDWAVECVFSGRVVDVDDFVMRAADESYSRHWDQGGPIIEREGIGTRRNSKLLYASENRRWNAYVILKLDEPPPRNGFDGTGPTPLIAAMRCFVASKLGDEIEVPDELVTPTA